MNSPNEPIVIDMPNDDGIQYDNPIGPDPGQAAPPRPGFFQKLTDALTRLSGNGEPSVTGVLIGSLTKPLVTGLMIFVIIAGWVLLGASSFTFGSDFIGAWLFKGYLSNPVSRMISGMTCWVLFDLSYTASLMSFIYRSKSNTQRAVYFFTFLVPFILGLAASVTGFALISENSTLTAAEIQAARQFGQAAIYGGLINLALMGILPTVFDPTNMRNMLDDVIESDMQSTEAEIEMIMQTTANKAYKLTAREKAYELGVARGHAKALQFQSHYLLADGADQLQRPNAAPPEGYIWTLVEKDNQWVWSAVPRFQKTGHITSD